MMLSVHIATGDVSLGDALRQDGHPALFYLLLGWWIDVFGYGDTAVRGCQACCHSSPCR